MKGSSSSWQIASTAVASLLSITGCQTRSISGTDLDGGDQGSGQCEAAGGRCLVGPDVKCAGRALPAFDCNPARDSAGGICCVAVSLEDAGPDAGSDAGSDAGLDAGRDAGADAGADAGQDAGADGGLDAGFDAGADGGGVVCFAGDAGLCVPGEASDLGSFVTFTPQSLGMMRSGDLNGDGLLDLVEVSPPDQGEGAFYVYLGLPDGGLSPGTYYPGYDVIGLAIGDLNGDGIPDVAVADEFDVEIFANDGGAGLTLWTVVAAEEWPDQIGIGDFNGDGIPDLAISTDFYDVEIALGQGGGLFYPPVAVPGTGGGILVVADLNQDCLADFVAESEDENGQMVAVLINLGDGGFQKTLYPVPPVASRVALIPNHNGPPDLVFAGLKGQSGVQVLRNRGDGTFFIGPSSPVGGLDVVVGDFNGDCIPDIATSAAGDCANSELWVLYGEPDGGLSAPVGLFSGNPSGAVGVLGPVGSPRAVATTGYCGNSYTEFLTVYGDASAH